jgi:predicted RNA binding protein YcfA (HicA-like mRNA interferase family)
MLGRLKPLSFREIKRRLESAGFVETSQKGSHVKFVRSINDVVDTVIVPKKSEVPVGTLRSILNQAHLNQDEWDHLG